MTRTHGRCAVGQQLVAKVPHGHRKTLTFVAGLRCDGIIAPCVLDHPINAVSFLAWVIQFLVPTLRQADIVVMDNLSSHKAAAVRRAIRAAGAKLIFLSLCSPDMNPIEQAFSQLKPCCARKRKNCGPDHHLHRQAAQPDYKDGLWQLLSRSRIFNLKLSRSMSTARQTESGLAEGRSLCGQTVRGVDGRRDARPDCMLRTQKANPTYSVTFMDDVGVPVAKEEGLIAAWSRQIRRKESSCWWPLPRSPLGIWSTTRIPDGPGLEHDGGVEPNVRTIYDNNVTAVLQVAQRQADIGGPDFSPTHAASRKRNLAKPLRLRAQSSVNHWDGVIRRLACLRNLSQLDQHSVRVSRVEEGDAAAAMAEAGDFVEQAYAFLLQFGQCAVDILDLEAEVE